jgi:K+-sensing histidine kinase KdpD
MSASALYYRLIFRHSNFFRTAKLQSNQKRSPCKGIGAMSDVEPKQQSDMIETADGDPLASEWLRYLASVAMTGIATVVAIGVDSKVNIPNLSLVFVIPVVIAGVSLGLGPSLCAAILGALAFNFFLTEPRYSLVIDDPSNVWAMALLFVVGLIVSGVAFTSHRRAIEASLLRRQATVLQNYSREVVTPRNVDAIASITSRTLAALFRVPAVVILVVDGRVVSVKRTGEAEPEEAELEAARSSLTTEAVLRSGVYPYEASRFDFWPVQTAGGQKAVIGLAFAPDERPPVPDTHVMVVADILALVLDRHGRADPG